MLCLAVVSLCLTTFRPLCQHFKRNGIFRHSPPHHQKRLGRNHQTYSVVLAKFNRTPSIRSQIAEYAGHYAIYFHSGNCKCEVLVFCILIVNRLCFFESLVQWSRSVIIFAAILWQREVMREGEKGLERCHEGIHALGPATIGRMGRGWWKVGIAVKSWSEGMKGRGEAGREETIPKGEEEIQSTMNTVNSTPVYTVWPSFLSVCFT